MEPSTPDLPTWLQIAMGAAVAIFTAIGGTIAYIRNLAKPHDAGSHIIMEQAALADMRPFRDALKALDRIAAAAERIEEIVRDAANEEEIERRAKALAAEMQREHDRNRP